MYPTRVVCRPSTGHRVARSAGPACGRNMSAACHPAPFIGATRHGGFNPFAIANNSFGDFQPFLRVLDETSRALDGFPFGPSSRRQARAEQQVWQPRFDVREVDDAYELRGELPGVENHNLEVEFSDVNTLVIRGRTGSERTETDAPEATAATTEQPAATPAADNDDAASVHSNDSTSSYVKPTVEDEEPTTATKPDSTASTATVAAAAPDPAEQVPEPESHAESKQPTSHYWLHERSTGSFQRSFAFAARVDHDGVTASLRNGILNVTVPKAPEPAARKIAVQ